MRLKKYFSIVRAGILDALQFRLAMFVTFIGNILYLLLVYNLWKAIYASSSESVINGMTFTDTIIYLVFASALFTFMEMWIVWNMGRDIQSGQIVVDLLKPMKYRRLLFCNGCGEMLVKFFTTFLPTAIVVFFVSDGAIKLGFNVLLFCLSVGMSMIINYYICFFTGTICMHTESIWGVNVVKEVVAALLSGAAIPIVFFPEAARKIVMLLPFQGIVNSPLTILLHPEYSAVEILKVLGLQLFWVLAMRFISQMFFSVSLKKITVNGG